MTERERQERLSDAEWTLGRAMVIVAILRTRDTVLRDERIGEALDLGAISYDEASEMAR